MWLADRLVPHKDMVMTASYNRRYSRSPCHWCFVEVLWGHKPLSTNYQQNGSAWILSVDVCSRGKFQNQIYIFLYLTGDTVILTTNTKQTGSCVTMTRHGKIGVLIVRGKKSWKYLIDTISPIMQRKKNCSNSKNYKTFTCLKKTFPKYRLPLNTVFLPELQSPTLSKLVVKGRDHEIKISSNVVISELNGEALFTSNQRAVVSWKVPQGQK